MIKMESWTNKQGGSTFLLTLAVHVDHVATIGQGRRGLEAEPVAAVLMALAFTWPKVDPG
ncbi:hypothetical protein MiYa_01346 [Microcystis aeruginosa NIES-2519]|uniref:Uncharacterized protein n=1 Tax=Microcystis aeruginosa NIES-2519 TaxID=2303981 RepID=A0A5A5RBR5_MICAE|nr:hypothetical protein MiYa_01346 [Microcystis aeruginosa NIES-2519]